MNNENSTIDKAMSTIIYETQFKIKAFFGLLVFSKVGIFIIFSCIFLYDFTVKAFSIISLLLYVYYKYENIKRHEKLNLFLYKFMRELRGKDD